MMGVVVMKMVWDLILIPWMMGLAAFLVTAGLVGLRTKNGQAPEGTVVVLMMVGILVAIVTALVILR